MKVAAVCGSLRAGSFNQALLNTAIDRAPLFGLAIVQARIDEFGLFNQDHEAAPPAQVLSAKRIIGEADCLLLVSPEANFGVPGVLKNAVDWLSRPHGDPTLNGRPMAVMGASTGYMGTERGQLAWRQMWHFFRAPVFSEVELTVSFAASKVADGRIVDAETIERLDAYLERLAGWLGRINPAENPAT